MTAAPIQVVLELPDTLVDAIADAVTTRIAASDAPTQWMGVPEAAIHLGMTEAAVQKAVQRGYLPCHQPFGPGSRYYFDPHELDRRVRGLHDEAALESERSAA